MVKKSNIFPQKHIKKKFLIEPPTKELDEVRTHALSRETLLESPKLLNHRIGELVYLCTETNYNYGGIIEKVDGQISILPVPDLTLVYFNRAYLLTDHVFEQRSSLKNVIGLNNELDESGINEVYNFYGTCSGYTIFLFTAIESFINSLIPDDFEYVKKTSKRTETYSKLQIQRFVSFKEKINEVLFQAQGKSFHKKTSSHTSRIDNLKEFRDKVVHTKSHSDHEDNRDLLKMAINFKYRETLSSVATFMNFYKPDYIEECSCGSDF